MAFILLVTLALAGCSTSNNGSAQPTNRIMGDSQTPAPTAQKQEVSVQEKTAQKQENPAPAATAQVDSNKISFQKTEVTPDWKAIEGFNAQYNNTLIEDGQGVLHLIYNDYPMNVYHMYQNADGSWSEPQLIVDTKLNFQGYCAGTTRDGSLYFAWKEGEDFANELIRGSTDVLHIKFYKDGQWQESPKTYDLKNPNGKDELSTSWFSVYFDTRNEPHFYYMAGMSYSKPDTAGLYLDGQQLTQPDDTGKNLRAVVSGIGDLTDFTYFYIDSNNVYHLMGCDEKSLIPGSYPQRYTRYLHSYSFDGGKTWEGPDIIFDGGAQIDSISYEEDSSGNLIIMAYCESDEAALLITTLKPDSYKAGTPEGFFGSNQLEQDLRDLPYEERIEYSSIPFRAMLLDSNDQPHFFTAGSSSDPFWDMTQIKGNAWAVSELTKPEEGAELTEIFRCNGSFIFVAKGTGQMEPTLYYAEIPAGR